MTRIKIVTVSNGVEALAYDILSNDPRADAAAARQLRNETGLEVRVYDECGLRGVMDAA